MVTSGRRRTQGNDWRSRLGQTVQAVKPVPKSLDTCGGACCGLTSILGLADFSIWLFNAILPSPGAVPSWSPGTSQQHVRIRIIKKKKVIMKKRKKLTRPSPLATARPVVTTSPAGVLDFPKEQEPGTTLLGALPKFAAPGAHRY